VDRRGEPMERQWSERHRRTPRSTIRAGSAR
jgi:hypothetical protein